VRGWGYQLRALRRRAGERAIAKLQRVVPLTALVWCDDSSVVRLRLLFFSSSLAAASCSCSPAVPISSPGEWAASNCTGREKPRAGALHTTATHLRSPLGLTALEAGAHERGRVRALHYFGLLERRRLLPAGLPASPRTERELARQLHAALQLPCSNLGRLASRARAPHGAPEDGLATAPLFGHVLRRGGSKKIQTTFLKT
jgi:hypothetical protein